jgi:drug/metabolite transporter (DMT)-like permease
MSLATPIQSTSVTEGHSRLLGIFLICLAAVAWAGLEWLGSRIPGGYSPYQIVWTRYGVHLLLMMVVLLPTKRIQLMRTSRPRLQIFRAGLMLVMPVCFITAAQRHLDPKDLWAVTWIAVPVVMVFAFFLLGERVTRSQWVVVALGLVGTWLVIGPPLPRPGLALGLAFGVAFSFGLYIALTRTLRAEYTSANLFHTAVWVFIPLTLYMPWVWQMPSLKALAMMVGIGVAGFALLLLLDLALTCAPAALVAPFFFTECLWNAVLRFFRAGQGMRPVEFAGAALIIGCCVWILVRELKSGPSRPKLVYP